MGVGVILLVNKLREHRKPSVFPSRNNSLCLNPDCDWEGDWREMPYKGLSSILSCPKCGGTDFDSVLKPEHSKLPPIEVKEPFEGERKHRYENGWRIY